MTAPTPEPPQLALDEMFAPKIAEALRERRRQVIAVAERNALRAMTDDELYTWATAQRCWLLTENVKDFRPIMLRALQTARVKRRATHRRTGGVIVNMPSPG